MAIRLDHMQPGQRGNIERVDKRDSLERLLAMGICEGRVVEFVQGGDPLIVKVFGSRIGLSARLAEHVYVDACCKLNDGVPVDIKDLTKS